MTKSKKKENNPHHISSWPENERPRERLLKYGATKLSDAELLAIFLRTGVKGKNARQLAQELLERFGGWRGLYAADRKELKEVKGLGNAKIAQLQAVLELSNRYIMEKLQEKEWVGNSQAVFDLFFQTMRDLDHEVFKIILLNSQNQMLCIVDAFKGSIKSSRIYPREVIKIALQKGASTVIFVHNHPSGEPTPSQHDLKLTQKLMSACRMMDIRVQDHLIIGDNRFFSFADEGLIADYHRELCIREEES